jgi:hypothetical protein
MDPATGQAPVEISFTATLDKEPKDPNVVATWNFGDASEAGSGMSVAHSYVGGGEFQVRVEVSGDGFGPLVATASLTLEDPPYPKEPGVFVAQADGPVALNVSSGTVGARPNALGNRWKISFGADFGKAPDPPDFYARKLGTLVEVQSPEVLYLNAIDEAEKAEVFAASRIPEAEHKKKMYIDPSGFYKRLPESYTHKFGAKQDGVVEELRPGLFSIELAELSAGDYAVMLGDQMWGFRVQGEAAAQEEGQAPE